MPDIQRVTSVSILGVTISNRLSVSEHVQSVISKCAQYMHALKILRSHCNAIPVSGIEKSVIPGSRRDYRLAEIYQRTRKKIRFSVHLATENNVIETKFPLNTSISSC